MASVLYAVNNTTQSVLTNANISPGILIHRNCQSQIALNGSNIDISGIGYFTADVSVTFTAPVAGNVTIALYADGSPIPGATATETITTASTEVRSIAFTTEILKNCCKNITTLTLVNTGVAITTSNVAIRVKRDA